MKNTDFDINRYLGTWYEIARFPNRFEKDLVGVTATYTMRKDGKIKVDNKGHKHTLDGELSQAIGKAKIPDKTNPRHLRVSFFWIFYADYDILEVDLQDYRYALVGSGKKYLWILSRTPQMDDETYDMLVAKAEELGYEAEKLIKVKQSGN